MSSFETCGGRLRPSTGPFTLWRFDNWTMERGQETGSDPP